MIHYLSGIKSQSEESHPRWAAPGRNAYVSAAAVAFLKFHGIVIQLLNGMYGRGSFQHSDFVIARKSEVETKMRFHAICLLSMATLDRDKCQGTT